MKPNKSKHRRKKASTTRRLVGAKTFAPYGIETYDKGHLVYFRIQPSNLSVLSPVNIEHKIRNLAMLLSTIPDIEVCCLDSSEQFDQNKRYLKDRIDTETNVTVRGLLEADLAFLDEMQIETSTSREFFLIARFRNASSQQVFNRINRIEKTIRDQNFDVRRAGKEDLKRTFAIYYESNVTSARLPDFDGEDCIEYKDTIKERPKKVARQL